MNWQEANLDIGATPVRWYAWDRRKRWPAARRRSRWGGAIG